MSDLEELVEKLQKFNQHKLVSRMPLLEKISEYGAREYVYVFGLWLLDNDVAPGTWIPEDLIVSYVDYQYEHHHTPSRKLKKPTEAVRYVLRNLEKKGMFEQDGNRGNLSYMLPEREKLVASFGKSIKTKVQKTQKSVPRPIRVENYGRKINKATYLKKFEAMKPEILEMFDERFPLTYREIDYALERTHQRIIHRAFSALLPGILSEICESEELRYLMRINAIREDKCEITIKEYYRDEISPLGTAYIALIIETAENTSAGQVLYIDDFVRFAESGKKRLKELSETDNLNEADLPLIMKSLVKRGFVKKREEGYITQHKLYDCFKFSEFKY
jgi:hypothetical protein